MAVKWRFIDPVDSTEQQFEVNPNSGGNPTKERKMTARSTVVAGGRTIKFEGNVSPDKIQFSGLILNEVQLNLYMTWFEKLHQVQLIDDLGRSFYVMMDTFAPKRVRNGRNFWRHTFDATLTVVDWP